MWRLLLALLISAQQLPSLTVAGDADAARVLNLSQAEVASLRDHGVLSRQKTVGAVPEIFFQFPVPQSLSQNAKARADLKAQGATEREIDIGERAGAFVAEDGGYWFGKSFYDAEGDTGRGDIGFITKDGRYSMLGIPALRRWSVSALSVERDAIWAGMVHRGESGVSGSGVLRYDRATKRTTTYRTPGVIHSIARTSDRIFIGTSQGPYMLSDGTVTRLLWK